MKKTLLLAIFVVYSALSFSQLKRQDISTEKIGPMDCKYARSIDLDKNDTTYYVWVGFQNQEYKSIVDIKSVAFFSNSEKELFLSDLKKGVTEMQDKKSNTSFNRENYKIDKYDFSKNLYLYERNKRGYTIINENQATKLAEWLRSIEIGK